jgi:hypothetical protein
MQLNLQNPARGQSTTRQGCREEGGGGGDCPGPPPQIEWFFKLVRAFFKLRAPYSGSTTCNLAEV